MAFGTKRMRKYFKVFTLNEKATYHHLWYAPKAVCRGKFIALKAYIRKEKSYHSNNLSFHIKKLKE